MDFKKLILENGKCCVTGRPLSDCASVNFVMLNKLAQWTYPVWSNVLVKTSGMALAFVHDCCVTSGSFKGEVKYAVEIKNGEIIYHPVESLEAPPPPKKTFSNNISIPCMN